MKYLHTMIRVKDIDESLKFFCDGLGLKETKRMENEKGRFTLVFLAIGAGAIFQVVLSIFQYMNEKSNLLSNTSLFAGISVGLLIMYLTSVLI